MKYDSTSDKILISCREFVTTARRGISTTLPYDSDEPELQKIPKRLLKEAIGDFEEEKISRDFSASGYNFTFRSTIPKVSECNLWFTMCVDSEPSRPKREYIRQLRGEGYASAYAYSMAKGYTRVKLNFIYINPVTYKFAESCEWVDQKMLARFFDKCVISVSLYARPEIERVTTRLPSMQKLPFPYESVREGQSEFVRRAYKTITRGGTLYATAPTGTGKTVSALFPAIRAMGDGKRDKTFYLTPKETTANAAIDCLKLMAEGGAEIRGLKLTAKEKQCENGVVCRKGRDKCENAKFNKLADAALSLYNLKKTVVEYDDIHSVAKEFKICPYELSLTYAELCDVVICDFNYLFDPDVYIRRFFTEGGNYTFLIDEAHNLPDRAREMFSAEINNLSLALPVDSEILGEHSTTKVEARIATDSFYDVLFPYVKEEIRKDSAGLEFASTHIKELPFRLYEIFDRLCASVEKDLFLNYSATDGEKEARIQFIKDYYYKIKKFRSVMERFDSSYEAFIFLSNHTLTLKLYCIDTGRAISDRVLKGSAAVFFSATLTPLYYYKSLLGGDGASDVLEVDSPFDSEQLSISIMDKISTRYSEREDTLAAVCRVIAATISARRGNYMIFSPSFEYSEMLAKAFMAKYPKLKILSQRRNMSAKEKKDFLDEFSKDDKSYLIGFCVMGGIYSEGIDLAGDSLIGAVVVGIGMPALSYEREAICAYYDEKYEEGKQFAYIYPGMNRVLQAAGRVIRREDDKGVIVLIDDRFDDPLYKKIIPKLWRNMKYIDDAKILREELDSFWQE